MIDIRFLRENPEAVKENIRKKFQDVKLPLVDEVVDLDQKRRAAIAEVESLKAARNKLSKANGPLYGQLKKCEDEAKKAELQAQIDQNNAAVKADDDRRAALDQSISQMDARIREIMYVIPNIIDPSVPIGPDDSCNVEVERFGDPVVPTILKSPTMWTSCRALMASTKNPPDASRAWAFTICSAISRGCMRRCLPTRAIS